MVDRVCTRGTVRCLRQALEGFGCAASQESQHRELVGDRVWHHDRAPSSWCDGSHWTRFGGREHDPRAAGTYMDPPALSRASRMENTLRNRCSHISGLVVKTSFGLRALMKSALPLLITTAASGALYLRRLGGNRSDLSCHQFDHTSHCAEGLLALSIKSKDCSNTCQRPV